MNEKKFLAIDADQSIFILANKQLFITIYINNLLLFRVDKGQIKMLKEKLDSQIWMTDLGDISHYLGMEVCQN